MKRKRFALKMKDDVEVRSLEELREAFDLGLVMGYLADGRLERWLEDRFYEEEAGQVAGLDKEAPDLGKRLCAILQVPYTEEMEMGLGEESEDWCPITRSIFKELAPLGMDAVIAKLLEDDRALQELAVGFSASVSGRGPGSVQQIDGEWVRLELEDIESVLTDASAQDKFQEHVFQWMRENLEGVNRNPSKYLMDELCRRMATMVRDSLSKLGDTPSNKNHQPTPIGGGMGVSPSGRLKLRKPPLSYRSSNQPDSIGAHIGKMLADCARITTMAGIR